MKKFMLVLTVAAVLFGAFALTGCNGKNATESYRNVYLVSAIAGANYLQQSAVSYTHLTLPTILRV